MRKWKKFSRDLNEEIIRQMDKYMCCLCVGKCELARRDWKTMERVDKWKVLAKRSNFLLLCSTLIPPAETHCCAPKVSHVSKQYRMNWNSWRDKKIIFFSVLLAKMFRVFPQRAEKRKVRYHGKILTFHIQNFHEYSIGYECLLFVFFNVVVVILFIKHFQLVYLKFKTRTKQKNPHRWVHRKSWKLFQSCC